MLQIKRNFIFPYTLISIPVSVVERFNNIMTKVDVIGRPLQVGGNTAQLTTNGKVKITDAEGKTKIISQKSFQKQLVQNADKINNGDTFEFKSNNTGKKIAAGLGIAGLITGLAAAVVYRKNIGEFFKNTKFKELGQDLIKKGKDFAADAFESGKNLLSTGWTKVKEFGTNALEYIKDIPNKFSKIKPDPKAQNNFQKHRL